MSEDPDGDVRSLLDQHGLLLPGRATEIISQVASALDAAHARGDRPDHVYLADFGRTAAGTPDCLAPERVAGRPVVGGPTGSRPSAAAISRARPAARPESPVTSPSRSPPLLPFSGHDYLNLAA